MENMTYVSNGKLLTRINKTRARNLYNKGVEILLIPGKLVPSFNGPWITPYRLNKSHVDANSVTETTFDHMVDSYESYNCNHEVGYRASYWVEEHE